jgi:DNA-binding NtrC family response regulator
VQQAAIPLHPRWVPGAAYAPLRKEEAMSEKNRLNVLVVDPDEATVLDLKEMLSELGYRASSNTNPEAVIEEIKHGTFQIVIADVSPPADRPLELLARMRAADSDVCVISMTAMPTVDVAVRAMKQHAFDYLQKPVELEELRHVIDAAVREKGLLVDVETRLNQIVGKRLRERRSESMLTLKQLANRTGLSVSLISQIELGKSAASMSTLYKLATALQVRMTYFFETV